MTALLTIAAALFLAAGALAFLLHRWSTLEIDEDGSELGEDF